MSRVARGRLHERPYLPAGLPFWRAAGRSARSSSMASATSSETTVCRGHRHPGRRHISARVGWARAQPGAQSRHRQKDTGEVKRAKDDGRLPMDDHGTRIIVVGDDAASARFVAQALAHEAFYNVSYFAGSIEEAPRPSTRLADKGVHFCSSPESCSSNLGARSEHRHPWSACGRASRNASTAAIWARSEMNTKADGSTVRARGRPAVSMVASATGHSAIKASERHPRRQIQRGQDVERIARPPRRAGAPVAPQRGAQRRQVGLRVGIVARQAGERVHQAADGVGTHLVVQHGPADLEERHEVLADQAIVRCRGAVVPRRRPASRPRLQVAATASAASCTVNARPSTVHPAISALASQPSSSCRSASAAGSRSKTARIRASSRPKRGACSGAARSARGGGGTRPASSSRPTTDATASLAMASSVAIAGPRGRRRRGDWADDRCGGGRDRLSSRTRRDDSRKARA